MTILEHDQIIMYMFYALRLQIKQAIYPYIFNNLTMSYP